MRSLKGTLSSILGLFIICVLIVIAYNMGSGNLIEGAKAIWFAWWEAVKAVAGGLISFAS